jgi:acetyltransferase-like isoleucine patch superfamily enzyme
MDDGLLGALRELRDHLDDEKRRAWDRSLPIGELLGDRWERAARLGFGDGSSVYDACVVLGSVDVGANTWIGPFTVLDGSGGGITIGIWGTVSAGVHIYTHETLLRSLSGGVLPILKQPVEIGDYCYIGPQSVIAAGTTVGSRSVIAANSFVNQPVPERTVVGGSPARVLGRVEGEGATTRIVYA